MPDVKRCRDCREVKDTSDFTSRRDGSGKVAVRCKDCERNKQTTQRQASQERQRERQRNTPQRSSTLKRTPLKQVSDKRTPMKRVSAQPNEYELEFRKMKPIVRQRSKHQCEAKTDVCIGSGQHIHHRKLRSQGGTNSEANLIDVCMPCHEWIHAHPALSYQHRWLLHGHDEETPLR